MDVNKKVLLDIVGLLDRESKVVFLKQEKWNNVYTHHMKNSKEIIEISIPVLKNNINQNFFSKGLEGNFKEIFNKAKELMISNQELFVIIGRGPPTQKDLKKPIKIFCIVYSPIQ